MNWEAVTAVSTMFIALVALGAIVVLIGFARKSFGLITQLQRLADTLDREARPLADKIRDIVTDTGKVADKLRTEIESIVDTTHDVHTRVVAAVDDADERLQDLGALLDVIQEEVEETVLDVGAALRSTRRGAGVLRGVKRALMGKKRRR